ncbi:MAG TPA: hypothetical protein VGR07_06465, partial [Thermoanaerobaculia bacterium]|nr:hypothetical protein [Thermoanaerobaculia bacterium]
MTLTTFYARADGQPLDLAEEIPFGAGDPARTYRLRNDAARVARLYLRPTPELGRKLRAMLAQPPADPAAAYGHVSIAWPVDLVEMTAPGGPVAGSLLPFVPGLRPLSQAYDPATRQRALPLFTQRHRHRAARNLAGALAALHANGTVVGGFDPANVLVTDTALVTLVGTDAFQVRDPDGTVHRAAPSPPEMTPPELQGLPPGMVTQHAPEDDVFGLGVLLFRLLMEGLHPFDGDPIGTGAPTALAGRIAAGPFPYALGISPLRPPRTAPPFQVLSPALQTLFRDCFEAGFSDPVQRPKAVAWQAALAEAERNLVPCVINPQHLYGRHLGACPWCARAAAARVSGTLLPGTVGAGALPGMPREGFRPPPKVAGGPVPVSAGAKNLLAGCLGVGLLILLAFFGYVYSFAKKDLLPGSTGSLLSDEKPVDPEAVTAMLQLQKRLTNPTIPGGCDPLARSWVRTLTRIAPVRGGKAALLPMLDKEVSYRTFKVQEPLDADCVADYLQALGAQAPGNWKYSPYTTGGMDHLVDLLDQFNRGVRSEDDTVLAELVSFAKQRTYCPPEKRCEVQIQGDFVQSETPTRVALSGRLEGRQELEDWIQHGGFRLSMEWDGAGRKWV